MDDAALPRAAVVFPPGLPPKPSTPVSRGLTILLVVAILHIISMVLGWVWLDLLQWLDFRQNPDSASIVALQLSYRALWFATEVLLGVGLYLLARGSPAIRRAAKWTSILAFATAVILLLELAISLVLPGRHQAGSAGSCVIRISIVLPGLLSTLVSGALLFVLRVPARRIGRSIEPLALALIALWLIRLAPLLWNWFTEPAPMAAQWGLRFNSAAGALLFTILIVWLRRRASSPIWSEP
jgi:hypothetical protein